MACGPQTQRRLRSLPSPTQRWATVGREPQIPHGPYFCRNVRYQASIRRSEVRKEASLFGRGLDCIERGYRGEIAAGSLSVRECHLMSEMVCLWSVVATYTPANADRIAGFRGFTPDGLR